MLRANDLSGRWRHSTVRGKLVAAGWGAKLGYPRLLLDPQRGPIEVYLFESSELPGYWPVLDEFEGAGYRTVVTQVQTGQPAMARHD